MTTEQPATAENQPATPELWCVHVQLRCVHVQGPDDVLACASKADAVRNALWLNLGSLRINLDPAPYAPTVWAVPVLWESTGMAAEEHAVELARHEAEDSRWTGGQPLAEIAAEKLGTAPAETPEAPADEAALITKQRDEARAQLSSVWALIEGAERVGGVIPAATIRAALASPAGGEGK